MSDGRNAPVPTRFVDRAAQPIEPPSPGWVADVVAASDEIAAALLPAAGASEEELTLDALYDRVDDAMIAGDFGSVDRELAAVDVETTSLTLLLGWLTITYPAKDKLLARAQVVAQTFARAEREQGTVAARDLMRGLMDDIGGKP